MGYLQHVYIGDGLEETLLADTTSKNIPTIENSTNKTERPAVPAAPTCGDVKLIRRRPTAQFLHELMETYRRKAL